MCSEVPGSVQTPQVPPETQLCALGLLSLTAVPSQAASPFLHLFILEVGLLVREILPSLMWVGTGMPGLNSKN